MQKKLVWTLIIVLLVVFIYVTFTDLPGARFISTVIGKILQALRPFT